jgi:hypothetical protein
VISWAGLMGRIKVSRPWRVFVGNKHEKSVEQGASTLIELFSIPVEVIKRKQYQFHIAPVTPVAPRLRYTHTCSSISQNMNHSSPPLIHPPMLIRASRRWRPPWRGHAQRARELAGTWASGPSPSSSGLPVRKQLRARRYCQCSWP